MKKRWKYIGISLLVLAAAGVAAFLIWTQQTYKASPELKERTEIPSRIDGWITYIPQGAVKGGIVLYPGAKVEPEAYSYIAENLADDGYVTGIPEVTLNLAMLDSDKAEQLIDDYPNVKHWYVGGHSLGGVAAASFASRNMNEVDGLILLASYPAGDDLSGTDFPILSIYGERDGLTTLDKVEETKQLLSNQTTWKEIPGGNHGQFGVYGPQKGDKEAEITVWEQQDIIINDMTDWIQDMEE
ncbi:alpha/beta hydrolase [Bacillus sp. SB49]|uniref:alpha/beta family hydrolase n=1 Tax=Bacillaceae TaxID=186817 RepID=UPI0002A51345|nr:MULTISPECIES: alpha/beta family hydrolase [Bacillaceae]ELK44686.1 hypothetical protein D479_18184 [Halobacillus sp. BAB-2008]QHT46979.1 alpha/beta hydrolase [Bacillus sp. SB49]